MEPSQESRNSVFDFVYLDTKRIALYLSQIHPDGNLTGLVRTVQESDEEKAGVRADVRAPGLRARISAEATEGQTTGVQKQYDTQWKQPIEFLKEIQALDMVKRTFEDVAMGDIFILPGNLSLIDVGMFSRVWDVVADQAKAQARAAAAKPPQHNKGRRAAPPVLPTPAAKIVPPESEWGLRLFGALDQPVFMNFLSKGRRFWAMGDSSAIIGSSASLAYKHGMTVPGTWHLLAILDAYAEDHGIGDPWLDRVAGLPMNTAGIGLLQIVLEFRGIFGRPAGCYGVTPLAVFREIGGKGHIDI